MITRLKSPILFIHSSSSDSGADAASEIYAQRPRARAGTPEARAQYKPRKPEILLCIR
jgi:hypothetical protein